jgi:DNA-binding PadR family transcriptional regulator
MSQKSAKASDFEYDLPEDRRRIRSFIVTSQFLTFLLFGDLALDERGYFADISKTGLEGYAIDKVVDLMNVSRRHVYRIFQNLRSAGLVKSGSTRVGSRGRPRKRLILTQKGRRRVGKMLVEFRESLSMRAPTERSQIGLTRFASKKTPEYYGFPEFQALSLPIVSNKVLWCPLEKRHFISLGVDWKLCTKCKYKRARIGDYVVCNHPRNEGIHASHAWQLVGS